ncbi:MAG TPA: 3-phosphoserine/phosphohydroxythreonine transaminase [Vicinamibacteria bacterium]|nr:3-phosphoserine/phosphohydroxythreonine transaminase [Vicinamibacteria bacterium]
MENLTTTEAFPETTGARIHNFGAGPAILPEPVLEQVRAELPSYAGTGMSVMELSHRSDAFEEIIQRAEADLRALLGVTADHAVLFLQGGATLQFAMVPMNLRPPGASADYVLTGHWAKAALKEAEKLGAARVAASTEEERFDHIPAAADVRADPDAAYLHFTSNNTIYGIEWLVEPSPPSGVPLVCDASSDALSRRIDLAKYGLVYAGAQKNLGPAGVTLVIVRRDLLERTPRGLPAMLDYRLQAENRSLYNTPPCFAIYVVGLVLQWLRGLGGLEEMERRNAAKAGLLYAAIDGSGGFYRGHARPDSRSRMNVTFRLPSEELEKAFLTQATAAGLEGLKGHRSVGGLRASLYNALPLAAVEALVAFMAEFRRRNG